MLRLAVVFAFAMAVPQLVMACGDTLPLHAGSGVGGAPALSFVGDVTTPHVRSAVVGDEAYRVGDVDGLDSDRVHLYAVRGPAVDDVSLQFTPAGCAVDAPTFADTGAVVREVHVATTGSPTGSGTSIDPYDTLERALDRALPGDRIFIHEGAYPGSTFAADVQGTERNPIWIGAAPGEAAPVLGSTGVGTAIQLSDPAWLVIEDIVVDGPTGNGINLDDGGDYTTPAHHVVVRRVEIRNIGTGGNQDCLKLSGLDDFWVLENDIHDCGAGGSGVDMVGCHDGLIAGNTFRDTGSNAVQGKGATARVTIRGNLMVDAGPRAMNLGGSTGLAFFRPPGALYEARDLRAIGNVIVGSDAPVAFVGCDGCVAGNNTFYLPERWVMRILQETTEPGFVPCRDGVFINNVVVFDLGTLSTFVNIGPDTLPDTFTFRNNLWFARDDPSFPGPSLPTVEIDPLIQLDPLLSDPPAEDFRLDPTSPAAAAGVCYPGLTVDREGVCYGAPPTLGAYELP